MKCLAIQSSPNKEGLTSTLAQAVLKGVQAEAGEIEFIHLNSLDIQPCTACDSGWGKCKTEGICTIQDDFEALRKKIDAADAVVFATPVYYHDVSESAKIFLDRLRRCESFGGFQSFTEKSAVGITSAGGSGRGAVRALYNLEDYLRRLGFQIFDLVPVTRFSKGHKIPMLKMAGKYLATL